jgi:hypothetical protein
LFASWVEEVKANIFSDADIDETYDIEPIPLNLLEEVQSKLSSAAKLAAAASKDVMDEIAEALHMVATGSNQASPDTLTFGATRAMAGSNAQGIERSATFSIPLSKALDDNDDELDMLTCNIILKSDSKFSPAQVTLKFSIGEGLRERMLTDEESEGLKHLSLHLSLSGTALAASSNAGYQLTLPLSALVADPSKEAAVVKIDEDDLASDEPSVLTYKQATLLKDILEAAKNGKPVSAKLTLD